MTRILAALPALILRGAALVAVIASAYVIYLSSAMPNSSRPMIVAGGFAVVAVVFFMLPRLINREWQTIICVALVSTSVALYAAEIFFASLGIPTASRFVYLGFDPNFDLRSQLQVVDDLRRAGDKQAVPTIRPLNSVMEHELNVDGRAVMPLGTISGRTTVACNEVGKWLIFKSDRHGFRNPDTAWKEPMDIALIGDSFGQGFCQEAPDTIAGKLRAKNYRVLNLSISGNGPFVQLGEIREFVAPRKPPIVIWLYFEGNDLLDLEQEWKHGGTLKRYLEESNFQQRLEAIQPGIDAGLEKYIRAVRAMQERKRRSFDEIRKIVMLQNLREVFGLGLRPPLRPTLAGQQSLMLFERVLSAAKATVDAWGGKMIFVYLPGQIRFASANPPDFKRSEILKIAQDLGLPIVDIVEPFSALPNPRKMWTTNYSGHYVGDGYQIVTEKILAAIAASGAMRKP